MKNIFLAFLFVMIPICCFAYDDTLEPLDKGPDTLVSKSPNTYQWIYEIPSVTQGADKVYRLETFGQMIQIVDVDYSPDSADVDVLISQKDAQDALSVHTRVVIEEFGTGDRPTIQKTSFVNLDGSGDGYAYVTFSNQTSTVTGTDKLFLLTFERY